MLRSTRFSDVLESLESRRLMASISGTVWPGGSDVIPERNRLVEAYTPGGQYVGSDATDDTGKYTIENLPAGSYRLTVKLPDSLKTTSPAAGFVEATVTADQTLTGQDLRIDHAYAQPVPDPNATIATAIPLGTLTETVSIDDYYALNSDREMFSFSVAEGQTVRFSIHSGGDHHLLLFDGQGNALIDRSGGGVREEVVHTFNEAGTYYVGVSTSRNTTYDPHTPGGSSGWNNSYLGDYKLDVSPISDGDQPGAGQWDTAEVFGVHRIYHGQINGAIARPADVDLFRFGPHAGGMGNPFGAKIIPDGNLKLFVKGYSSPGVVLYDYGPATADRPLAVPFSLLDGDHYVEVRSDGQTTGQYKINIYAGLDVYDSNKTHYMPIDGGAFDGQPKSSRGFIQYQGDINVHRFTAESAGRVRVRAAADDGATLDPKIRVYRVDNGEITVIGSNDNAEAGKKAAELMFDAPAGVPLYVEVMDAASTGIGDYTVEMTAAPAVNRAPTIGSLGVNPTTVKQGQPLTLLATDVADPDGDGINRVTFFRDANDNGLYDAEDQLLGHDLSAAGGWTTEAGTGNLAVGTHRFFAFAYDGKAWSTRSSVTATVEPADIDPGDDLTLQFTSLAQDVTISRGQSVQIAWNDGNVAGSTVKFYATRQDPAPDTFGPPAFEIASFSGADGANSFFWDTSKVGAGTYTIVGRLYTQLSSSPVVPSIQTRATAPGQVIVSRNDYVRGDFDGDGQEDLVFRNAQTGQVSLRLMNGVQTKSTVFLPTPADAAWEVAGTGDFDADGDEDILFQHAGDNRNSIWLMNGTQVQAFKGIAYSPNLDWKIATAGDFDRDGKPDLVWRNHATGHNTFWLMNGTSIKGFKGFGQTRDLAWRIGTAADFDGDGKLDLAWKKADDHLSTIWLMNGPVLKGYVALPPTLHGSDRITDALDFDGDGDEDLLLATGGSMSIWWMKDASVADVMKYTLP